MRGDEDVTVKLGPARTPRATPATDARTAEWEILVGRYGRRTTTRSDVFLNHQLYAEADAPIGMEYFVWVVRNDASTFVIDTGFSRAAGDRRGRETLVDVRALYDQLEVDPAAAPTVVITHAHYDHIGNLDLFPRSRVVLARRELDFWNGPLRHKRLFGHSVEEVELAHLRGVVAEGRATLFEDRLDLAPGVEVVTLGGHTPGQSVLRVNTTEGMVLLASDAVHYHEELERDMPFSSVVDLPDMYAGFAGIRAMLASGEVARVVPGHDPATLSGIQSGIDPAENVVTIGGRR